MAKASKPATPKRTLRVKPRRANTLVKPGVPAHSTRLWVCTDHAVFFPVGGASIVMADTEEEARTLLTAALAEASLNGNGPFTLVEINMSLPFARVLRNGNY